MQVVGKGRFFYAPVNTSFLKSFQGSGLRMGETGFDTAFGKCPASFLGLHEQELNTVGSNTVTDGGYLLAFLEAAQM